MRDYNEEERKWINWLYHVPWIGRKKLGVILSSDIVLPELCRAKTDAIMEMLRDLCGFAEKEADKLCDKITEFREMVLPDRLWNEMNEKQISFLLPQDPLYPTRLREIPDAPIVLYLSGKPENATAFSAATPVVAVVGARECSEYGKYVANQIGKRCAQLGMGLVSGMACGVDGMAQMAALGERGAVAAVLGSGADVCYPEGNRKVYDGLVQSGCIFSEYVPGTEPKPNYFPPRNRIISGIADALIVVEAKEKSGTLITVDMALEQGREVYVVPGRLTDPMSRGCNRLVRQGASVVCDVDETLAEIMQMSLHNTIRKIVGSDEGPVEKSALTNPYPKGSLRYEIRQALDLQPKSVQQIYEEIERVEDVTCPITALQTELFYMQMEGTVSESDGRFLIGIG